MNKTLNQPLKSPFDLKKKFESIDKNVMLLLFMMGCYRLKEI